MSDVLVVLGLGLIVAAVERHFGVDAALLATGLAFLVLALALADGLSARLLVATSWRRARSKLTRAKRSH